MKLHPAIFAFFRSTRKWLLLAILAIFCISFFYYDLDRFLTLDSIKTYQDAIQQWAASHYFTAAGLYILIFTLMIASTIPGATLLTLLGGFLFGASAIFYAIAGIALGGTILFFAVRTAVGTSIASRSSGWIKKVEQGFQKNAFHYILMFRLVPIFPCWVSNIAAGALNVPYGTFLMASIIGVTPATVIYVMLGRGLDKLLMTNQPLTLSTILTPAILLPLAGLAFLSLIPVFYKRKHADQSQETKGKTDTMNDTRPPE